MQSFMNKNFKEGFGEKEDTDTCYVDRVRSPLYIKNDSWLCIIFIVWTKSL